MNSRVGRVSGEAIPSDPENDNQMRSLPNHSHTKLRVGDLVEVMSAGEILRTLDVDGSLDGLPFMPEMVQHCGRRARLSCRALKTCVECLTDKRFIDIRGFGSQDVWVLEDLRCSGADHDGCQRGCLIFWKSRLAPKGGAERAAGKTDPDGHRRVAPQTQDEDRTGSLLLSIDGTSKGDTAAIVDGAP